MKNRLASLVAVLCVVACAPTLLGQDGEYGYEVRTYDTVVLAAGRELDGEILELNDDFVEFLDQKNIKQQFRRADVKKIIRSVSPQQAYRNRTRHSDYKRDDYAQQWKIGEWASRYVDAEQYEDTVLEQAIEHLEVATRIDASQNEPYGVLVRLFDEFDADLSSEEMIDLKIGVYLRGLEAGVDMASNLAVRTADLLERRRDFESAIVVLRKIKKAPTEVGERIADLLNRSGRRGDAREWVEELLDGLDDDDPGASEARERLQAMNAGWLLEDVALGDRDAQERFLEAVGSLDEESGMKHLLRGSYFLVTGDPETAEKPLARAISLGVYDAPAIVTYAILYAQLGKSSVSRLTIENARKVTNVRVQLELVRAYLEENDGHKDDALQILRTTVAENPDLSWQTWIIFFHALNRLAPEEALEDHLRPFLKKFADQPVAFAEGALLLADRALRAGDGDKARRWFDYAGAAGGEGVEFFLGLAHAHMLPGGNPERARAALQLAEQLGTTDLDVWNTLAYAHYQAGAFARAREQFERVVDEFKKEERESDNPPPQLAYALDGLYLVGAATSQELWVDQFDRTEGERVMNDWEEEETYGIELGVRGGSAYFSGVQEYEDEGRTVLFREIVAERLARVRVRLQVDSGLDKGTLGLRVESEDGNSGLVFFRHPDGDLAFSMNQRTTSDVVRAPKETDNTGDGEKSDAGGSVVEEYAMQRVVWPASDRQSHTLEFRFDVDGGGEVELYFDGRRIARRVRAGFARSGILRVGVSFMAPKRERCDVTIESFEVFKLRPQEDTERKY